MKKNNQFPTFQYVDVFFHVDQFFSMLNSTYNPRDTMIPMIQFQILNLNMMT